MGRDVYATDSQSQSQSQRESITSSSSCEMYSRAACGKPAQEDEDR